MNIDRIKELKVLNVKTKNSLLFFTRYFFKKKNNEKFQVDNHHEQIAEVLERVIKGEIKRLIINVFPRSGKTELAVKHFISYGLALNPTALFIHLSGSNELALDNSEFIRDLIQTEDYQELYPEVALKTKGKKKWYTTKGGGLYATSAGGQITGFGAGKVDTNDEDEEELKKALTELEQKEGFGGAIIIDDPIKPEDAESKIKRGRVNHRYDTTIKNRVNSRNTPIILIMQRLHPEDLCGHLLKNSMEDWHVLTLPAIIEEDGIKKALAPRIHTLEELRTIRGKTTHSIVTFDRQYMQQEKSMYGKLYTEFKTYKERPHTGIVKQYIDTADEGDDFLCAITWEENGEYKYVIDVIYTQDRQEITEPLVAKGIVKNQVNITKIESNNGGRAFSRNVKRICDEEYNHLSTKFKPFFQSKHKQTRIRTNSTEAQRTVLFPEEWGVIWPEFYDVIVNYLATGENEHDDGPDALTGVTEGITEYSIYA